MSKHDIRFKLNGKWREVTVESNELLLNVLRDKLYLTGTKYGCGIAECGACSILVDGKVMFSCLIPAVSADGWNITTVEGLAGKEGKLNAAQKAFIDKAAIQCGFCTPGMVVTATSLLNENPKPTEYEIKDYMRGNYCRCTGYTQIVDAVKLAASRKRARK